MTKAFTFLFVCVFKEGFVVTLKIFMYLFMAVLGLLCWHRLSLASARGLLMVVAAPVSDYGL